jgi:hypothetical protein
MPVINWLSRNILEYFSHYDLSSPGIFFSIVLMLPAGTGPVAIEQISGLLKIRRAVPWLGDGPCWHGI